LLSQETYLLLVNSFGDKVKVEALRVAERV